MVKLTDSEVKIVKELIRNPRVSDSQVAKKTGIPVMTVNRKRKQLEEKGVLRYYCSVQLPGEEKAVELFIVKLKIGITKEDYLSYLKKRSIEDFYSEHVVQEWLGEKDGHLTIMMVAEARSEGELIDCFNGRIVQNFKNFFGKDCIREVITVQLIEPLREHHNYLPLINIEQGILTKDWLNELIYVKR